MLIKVEVVLMTRFLVDNFAEDILVEVPHSSVSFVNQGQKIEQTFACITSLLMTIKAKLYSLKLFKSILAIRTDQELWLLFYSPIPV